MSKNETQNLQADVVVIGSGGGLAAAVLAAEGGASVILLEKVGVVGGWTRAANAFMAVESPLQKRQGVTLTVDEFFKKGMAWHRWFRMNPRILKAFLKQSGETIRYLEDIGVEFELVVGNFAGGPPTIHVPGDMMAEVQKALIKRGKELGMKTLTRTSGKKIIRGANGRVIGVVAVDKDGNEFEIQARSVVIATGGFGANRELLKKYCPDYYDDMHLWEWPANFSAHSGDGMYMAEEIGAAMAEWVPIYHRAGPDLGGYPWKPVLPRTINQYMVWVNKLGQRFADESSCMGMYAGNALREQLDQVAYALFSDDLVQFTVGELKKDPNMGEMRQKQSKLGGGAIIASNKFEAAELRPRLKELSEKKGLKIADSWEELAELIGIDAEALKAEVDEYNSYCDKGHDDTFARDPKSMMPMRKPPFYAVRIYGDAGETLGGIKVDEHMAVLDKQWKPIPGVFAAGVIADGHQGQTYNHDDMAGSAAGFAVNSGFIAGISAAKFITGK